MRKISFCITTLNRCNLLIEAIDSILGEFDDDVEIIVVDGGSTDNTPYMMNKFKVKHDNFIYIYEEGLDVHDGIIKSINASSGEYCWLFSDDDMLAEGAKKAIINLLNKNSGIPGVTTNYSAYDNSLKKPIVTVPAIYKNRIRTNHLFTDSDQMILEFNLHLGFISAQIINRKMLIDTYLSKLNEKECEYREWVVVDMVLSVFHENMKWLYCSFPCVKYRSDNDSFVNSLGVLKRIELSYISFPKMVEKLCNNKVLNELNRRLFLTRLLRTLINLKAKGVEGNIILSVIKMLSPTYKNVIKLWPILYVIILIPSNLLSSFKKIYLKLT